MNMTGDHRSWADSPCSSCLTSPCCTRLPLHRSHVATRADFDLVQRFLRHPRVEVGLYESGWWMAYYLAPCRFLDPYSSKCLVHGSERQPQICRHYSPVRCWYKRVFVSGISPDFIRFNDRRLEAVRSMVSFDGRGTLTEVPSWEAMQDVLQHIPIDAVTDSLDNRVAIEQVAPAPESIAEAGMAFPFRTPRTRSDLEVVRFRLGFHGTRIAVSRDGWETIIGDPAETRRAFMVDHDTMDSFLAAFTFDESGAIVSMPDFDAAAPSDPAIR